MKRAKTITLKGSSMVEVLIALAITSFCASLAVIIFLNLQKSSLPFFKLRAVELAEFYMQETLEQNRFTDENYTAEEFTVKKSISIAERFPDCFLLRIVVFDASRKKLFEMERIVKQTGQ